jgi:hypothetical protein
MKGLKQRKGQFIIIAALMVSIMIVSIGAILYGTVTYFRHERWEEYLSLIDTLKMGSHRVVEISLANYTLNMSSTILKDNLNKWRINLTKAYSGFGVVLTPEPTNGTYQAYNLTIDYSMGLNYSWYTNVSFSAANVTFHIDVASIGLTGYKFISTPLAKVEILSATYDSKSESLTITLTVEKEGLIPVPNLTKSSFFLYANNGTWSLLTLADEPSYSYDSTFKRFTYKLYSDSVTQPSEVSVVVIETRSIKVIANSTVTT